MRHAPPVSDRAGSSCCGLAGARSRAWQPLFLIGIALLSASATAAPLSSPPVAGQENGQFFQTLDLLDAATLNLPSLPGAKPRQESVPQPAVPEAKGPAGSAADAWVWDLGEADLTIPRQGPPPVRPLAADASGWWRRAFARLGFVVLACLAIAAFAVMFTIAQRR